MPVPGRNHTAFCKTGSGPPLLLLHGLLGSTRCWRYNLPALRAHFTCWAFDLPGLGDSDPLPAYDMSLPGLAAWLAKSVRFAGGGRVPEHYAIVASSWGGAVALQFASGAGAEGLDRMVLVAPVHPWWRPSSRQRLLLRRPWGWLGALWLRHADARAQRYVLGTMFGRPARVPSDGLECYRGAISRRDLGRSVGGYARRWRRQLAALAGRLQAIRCPVLLLWGGVDRAVPAASAAALQAALPSADLQFMPYSGHLPFEEEPGEFNRHVLAFLTR